MAKIIYHLGTNTYFGLDDDVYVMDLEGDEIAVYWGRRIKEIITEDN
jgi:hypothetical protein